MRSSFMPDCFFSDIQDNVWNIEGLAIPEIYIFLTGWGGKGRAEKFLSMIDHLDLSHNFFFFFTVKSVQNNDNVNKLNT